MRRILLIEDDSETAAAIMSELTESGFEVRWAADGIGGLDRARESAPDAMIVDRMLPGMDGLTVIEALRKEFEAVAVAMLELVDTFGHTQPASLYKVHCPMAFDNKGAPWLQTGRTEANPYFGHEMLRCGEIKNTFAPAAAAEGKDDSGKEDLP